MKTLIGHPTLFRNMDDKKFQEERKIIKSCSADDAKMASTGLIRQQNVKQRHMFGTGTLKSGGVNIVVWAKHSLK
jgi:hypothetical protein